MNLKELLALLNKLSIDNKINQPYIVGGIPRDLIMDKLINLNDIDITTGSDDIHKLADIFAKTMKVEPKIFKDGHRKVVVEKYSFDFSSNFKEPDIDNILQSQNIKTASELVKETFSRDFTINTLLIPLDFSEIIDLTKHGISDCKNKIIDCPINPDIVFKSSPNRIVRAFYYAAQYDLTLSDNVKNSIKRNSELLTQISQKYATDKISQALSLQPDLLDIMIELGVLKHLPLTTNISDFLIKQRRLLDVIK